MHKLIILKEEQSRNALRLKICQRKEEKLFSRQRNGATKTINFLLRAFLSSNFSFSYYLSLLPFWPFEWNLIVCAFYWTHRIQFLDAKCKTGNFKRERRGLEICIWHFRLFNWLFFGQLGWFFGASFSTLIRDWRFGRLNVMGNKLRLNGIRQPDSVLLTLKVCLRSCWLHGALQCHSIR